MRVHGWREGSRRELRARSNRLKGQRYGGSAAAPMAQMLGAWRDFEPQVGRGSALVVTPDLVFPDNHPPAQYCRVDAQCIADDLKGEGVMVAAVGHDPSLGIDVQHLLKSACGWHPLLINVDCVSQQGEHQALLAAEP